MAVSPSPKRKPTKAEINQADPNEAKIQAMIEKGGSPIKAVKETRKNKKETTTISLRLPPELLNQIDANREEKPFKVSRNNWILEAITTRLKDDSEAR